jgi:predicted Zn-dependent protease
MPTIRLTIPRPATTRPRSGLDKLVVIRDTETETLLRTYTNPLFRAAGREMALVRSIHLRDAALNSFMDTGNPVFMDSDPPPGWRPGGETTTDENRKGF